ncbi:lysophospholipid acyltransferase family protein [Alsobacter sp. R-9]
MPLLQRGLVRSIEVMTGQPQLARLYRDFQRTSGAEAFWSGAVRRLRLHVRFERERLHQLPASGPAVVVANHPYGVLDGIVLGWLASQVRPDFRILTNAVLYRAPEVRSWLLPVDFSGTREAMATNIESRRLAHAHLATGGLVLVFPAGGVSTSPDRWGRLAAQDAPWQPFVAQLVQRHRCPVLPVFFHGQNSRLFQIASHVSQTLRLSLLFKEVRDRIDTPVDVTIGPLIPFADVARITDRAALCAHLRDVTYGLADDPPSVRVPTRETARSPRPARSG